MVSAQTAVSNQNLKMKDSALNPLIENAEFEWKLLKRKVLNEKVKWNRISSELTIKFGGGGSQRGRTVVVATTTRKQPPRKA